MTHTETAAYIMAQTAIFNANIIRMQAANSQHPEEQPYSEQDFKDVIYQAEVDCLGVNTITIMCRDAYDDC